MSHKRTSSRLPTVNRSLASIALDAFLFHALFDGVVTFFAADFYPVGFGF